MEVSRSRSLRLARKSQPRLALSLLQTDGNVPNTLVIANCEVVKSRVAAAEHISQFNEEARSPFVKKFKTIIHPGELDEMMWFDGILSIEPKTRSQIKSLLAEVNSQQQQQTVTSQTPAASVPPSATPSGPAAAAAAAATAAAKGQGVAQPV